MRKLTKSITKKNIALLISAVVLLLVAVTLAYFTASDQVTNRVSGSTLGITLVETKWRPSAGRYITPEQVLEKNPVVRSDEETPSYIFLKVTVPYLPNVTLEYNEDEYATEEVTDANGDPVLDGEGNPVTQQVLVHAKGSQLGMISDVPLFKFLVTNNGMDTASEGFTSEQLVHSDCWTLVSEPTKDPSTMTYTYIYAYTHDIQNPLNASETLKECVALEQGESTAKPLFDKVKLINFTNYAFINGKSYSIDVDAYGIQNDHILNSDEIATPEKVWQILVNERGELQ